MKSFSPALKSLSIENLMSFFSSNDPLLIIIVPSNFSTELVNFFGKFVDFLDYMICDILFITDYISAVVDSMI